MTIEEFNETGFGANMFAMYRGKKYPIVAVAFDEALVALQVHQQCEPSWVRCENVTLTY